MSEPTWADFWRDIDNRAAAAKHEFDQTKAEVEAVVWRRRRWRFTKIEGGCFWVARHPEVGEVKARTSAALIAEVKRISEVKERTP